MTKYFISILILFSIQAQSQISFYGSTGINISSINYNLPQDISIGADYSSAVNPFVTLGLESHLNNKLNLIGELSYSQLGFKFINTFSSFQSTARIQQLNLQAGVSYKLRPINIEIGGFVAHKLSYKFKITETDWTDNFDDDVNFNAGLFAGINATVYKKVGLVFRYYYGLSPFSKTLYTDTNGNPAYELKEKINNFQLGITYKF